MIHSVNIYIYDTIYTVLHLYMYLSYVKHICKSYVNHMCIICISYVYHMYIICISYVYHMYIICISYVYHMYIICISYVYHMYSHGGFLSRRISKSSILINRIFSYKPSSYGGTPFKEPRHSVHGSVVVHRFSIKMVVSVNQWEFQDPKMEVLYHIRPYFWGIFPYIGLT